MHTLDRLSRAAAIVLSWLAAAIVPAPLADAAAQVALNRVWARLADLNGELGSVESAQFSPDGRFIVTGTKFDYSVTLWRTSDGAEIWRIHLPQEVEKVAWTRDGTHVASVSEDFVLRLIRASDGRIVKEVPHEQGIDSIRVSYDGKWLATGEEHTPGASGARSGWIRIFSLPDLRLIKKLDHGATVNELDFTTDDRYLVSAGDNGIARLWRTADWSLVRDLKRASSGEHAGFVCARFSPDDRYVAVSGFGGDVYVWRIADGERIRRFNRTARKNETLEWTRDGKYLLAAGHDDAISLYRFADIANGEIGNDSLPVVRVAVSDHLEFMQLNAAGTLLATAHQDGTVQLWTFMSDDPNVNARRHAEVKRVQEEAARKRGAASPDR